MRSRASLVLFGTLLLAIVTVSGFTIVLLRGQRAILDETLHKSESESLILVANRIEQVVLRAVRPPFRALKNMPMQGRHLSDRFRWVQQQFPGIEQCLALDSSLRVRASSASAENAAESTAVPEWLMEHLEIEQIEDGASSYDLHGFVGIVKGLPTLFVLQPLDDADHRNGWLAIGFDLERLQREYIAPLLDEFRNTHRGDIQLKAPESEPVKAALSWPVGPILPGWNVIFEADPRAAAAHLRRERLLTLGVASAVLFALLIATLAVWMEIRRERALLALRNRFIANVSHELRTPIALIKLYTETLYLGRLTGEARRNQYYQTILRECERLSRMVENVLDFARISKGLPRYRLTETDIGRTVARVIEDYRPNVTEKGLQLHARMQPNLPPVLHDPHGITQILLNLMDNAVKYAAEGKSVTVALEQEDKRVQLRVTDDGPGAAAADVTYNANIVRSHSKGIGFGLAIVRQIAKVHGATFSLHSEPGQPGTEAMVSFPIEPPAP